MKVIDLQTLKTVIEPVAQSRGYELVDVEWKTEQGQAVLRVFVDREGGVSLDGCAEISRDLSPALDVSDAIPSAYTLEVSSPGLNRPLTKESDFRRFVGKRARIRTRHGVEGDRRNFSGRLVATSEGKVKIDVGDRTFEVPVDDVEKANLVYEF